MPTAILDKNMRKGDLYILRFSIMYHRGPSAYIVTAEDVDCEISVLEILIKPTVAVISVTDAGEE
jgi:hypothetical protein